MPLEMEKVAVLEAGKSLLFDYTQIRDKRTTCADFCFYSNKIIMRLLLRSFDLLEYEMCTVETPIEAFQGVKRADNGRVCAVSIMRAGDSMVDIARQLYPGLAIGKILIQRDEETAMPVLHYAKLCPDISQRTVLLLDPMLATGGSAIKAVEVLLQKGVQQGRIIFVNLISCPEGLEAFQNACPEVRIVTGFIDQGLNEKKYIVPGLGDFGDRYYGTN